MPSGLGVFRSEETIYKSSEFCFINKYMLLELISDFIIIPFEKLIKW